MEIWAAIALAPRIEDDLPGVQIDEIAVAAVTSMTMMYAIQIFTSAQDSVWVMKNHRVGSAKDVLDSLAVCVKWTTPDEPTI